jgi:hypothetical protein
MPTNGRRGLTGNWFSMDSWYNMYNGVDGDGYSFTPFQQQLMWLPSVV